MKRVFLFVLTNIAVLLVLSITLRLLGVESLLQRNDVDLDYESLLVIALVFGMGGSFVSLAISKWTALRMTGAQVIENPRNDAEAWLVETVRQQARAANIGVPQVAIFPSDEPNAFATGARRNSALVAVSTGLFRRMDRREIEAVLGHEVSHIANGDMVTLTLIQGVVNTFVLFLSRVIGHFVDRVVFRNEEGHGIGFFAVTIAAQLLLGILASIVVCAFSRRREFRADAGGARLAGTPQMIGALERLKAATHPLPDQMQAFGIAGGGRSGLLRLFMTHPPIDERIAALRNLSV
jgi:heat shock protein HtpX